MQEQKLFQRIVVHVGLTLAFGSTVGCTPLKPYEKEYLLEPVMGDDITTQLNPTLMVDQTGAKEKLSSSAGGGVSGTSCPTCGG
jgi:hypothetical protein